ncbi:MAG TPA: bifunctional DNA-formamidopyrimidine glycosylase/DNA-(apurinic or apyrimidinic site) lyase [Burkholderiaceae bacterium]|nr:bifunctional DNA-formamidopyrimidine glycosylase/DNA-(apurinic or apyrimidinic site) lyase [Burkholderiaceae bacterium]
MPELPEVEVVRSGLAQTAAGRRVVAVERRAPALRWPIPADLPERLAGRVVRSVERRGKYLLLAFDHGWLIVHLGMSGTIAWSPPGTPLRAHDHLDLVFDAGVLRLNDPRRFGAVLWHDAADGPPHGHPLLASLGVEPFSEAFDGALLFRETRGRRVAIKQLLLSGTVVVGVGNIYASESLFRARIRPSTPAHRIGRERYDRLARAIRETLAAAIAAGGSTLRDFVSSEGTGGYFQLECLVYDRAGEPCRVCGDPVRTVRQQQRATYWCARCQS